MDASEHEADAKLYKASAELLSELLSKLPSLVEKPGAPGSVRKWVIETKVYSINSLLDRFQEWPQLLDPHLANLIQNLVDAFLKYCIIWPQEYAKQHEHHGELCPLPRAVSRVLYTFCKVRGHKVIIRLLNNEPKYVEPILTCFHLWSSSTQEGNDIASDMIWEEKYIMLLWLSHLMLAPFELSSISALAVQPENTRFSIVSRDLPEVAQNLLELALDHLKVSSKAREAASALAVRLSLRRDMQAQGLPGHLITWVITQLSGEIDIGATGYHYIGLLSLLFGLSSSASDSEIAPFIQRIFQFAHGITSSTQPALEAVRNAAPARKLLIKIMRSTAIHAVSLSMKDPALLQNVDVEALLEDCIQALLEYLSDNDTPVRQAASKALSLVALRLDSNMSAEVGEAVLACLNENMLLQDIITGQLLVATDMTRDDAANYKKNLNAVNPLQWHGAMLTIGHLLFRRALPTDQLPVIIEALLMGLEFEQRSSVGTSVGVGVRDAACFGLWSLARKYSTVELSRVKVTLSMHIGSTHNTDFSSENVIQTIATHLVVAACLDPAGNLRRGSSAALQELIGRHPDVVAKGIPVVQVVDYHAVARRSRAMIDVASGASELDVVYHRALIYSLLRWRGARTTDPDSRRQASFAVQKLAASARFDDLQKFSETLLTEIGQLKPTNGGSNGAARHGLLLVFASVLEAARARSPEEARKILDSSILYLNDLSQLTGDLDSRVTPDLENVFESTSAVIAAAAGLTEYLTPSTGSMKEYVDCPSWISQALPVLDRCTTSTDSDIVTASAATAYLKLFSVIDAGIKSSLLTPWLNSERQRKSQFRCKGRIITIGLLFDTVNTDRNLSQYGTSIILYLCHTINNDTTTIETKVNAMRSLGKVLMASKPLTSIEQHEVIEKVCIGLADYSIDQRGDIGSLLRLESIETARTLLSKIPGSKRLHPVQQLLVKLATEKLAKIRFQAWSCVKGFWPEVTTLRLERDFDHLSDVSSQVYFETMLQLSKIDYLHDYLVLGLITSSAASTDDISRACTEAVVSVVLGHEADTRDALIASMMTAVVHHLSQLADQDDRDVVPTLDFLTFMLDHVLPLGGEELFTDSYSDNFWPICQTVHGQQATIPRLEALARLYTALLKMEPFRVRAANRLTRLLLHRWPKIRTSAAEGIHTVLCLPSLIDCDWNAPVADNKSTVLHLRKELGVAGAATK